MSNSCDTLNRLTTAGSSDSYGYDPAGNLTNKTVNGTNTTYTYNAGNELTTSGYSYDANGNLKGGVGGFTASYNTANQAGTINGVTQGYTDVGQTFRTANGTTTFQNDPTGIGTMIAGSITSSFTRLPDGTLLGERIYNGSSTSYYYDLTDGNGSVLKVVDSSGAVKNSYAYDPYGNATTASETVSSPFRFEGSVWDATPKVYKMGARYYDPSSGRWSQMDSLAGAVGDPQSLNRYSFVEGDPVLFLDVAGTCSTLENAGAIGGTIGGVLVLVGTIATAPLTLGGSLLIAGSYVLAQTAAFGAGYCLAQRLQ